MQKAFEEFKGFTARIRNYIQLCLYIYLEASHEFVSNVRHFLSTLASKSLFRWQQAPPKEIKFIEA